MTVPCYWLRRGFSLKTRLNKAFKKPGLAGSCGHRSTQFSRLLSGHSAHHTSPGAISRIASLLRCSSIFSPFRAEEDGRALSENIDALSIKLSVKKTSPLTSQGFLCVWVEILPTPSRKYWTPLLRGKFSAACYRFSNLQPFFPFKKEEHAEGDGKHAA